MDRIPPFAHDDCGRLLFGVSDIVCRNAVLHLMPPLNSCEPVASRLVRRAALGACRTGVVSACGSGRQRRTLEFDIRLDHSVRLATGCAAQWSLVPGVAGRRARSVALREAVGEGWDANKVTAVLLGSTDPTLW